MPQNSTPRGLFRFAETHGFDLRPTSCRAGERKKAGLVSHDVTRQLGQRR